MPGEGVVFEELRDGLAIEDALLDEGVSLLDGDDSGHHVAEPAGVDEVQLVEVVPFVVVVQQGSDVREEEGGRLDLLFVADVRQLHLLHQRLELFCVHDGLAMAVPDLQLDGVDVLLEGVVAGWDLPSHNYLTLSRLVVGDVLVYGVLQVADVLEAHHEPDGDHRFYLQLVPEALAELFDFVHQDVHFSPLLVRELVEVGTDDDHQRLRSAESYVVEPGFQLLDALVSVLEVEEEEVERALGEEALVGGVVVLLAAKVPDAEKEGLSQLRSVDPLAHVDTVRSCVWPAILPL